MQASVPQVMHQGLDFEKPVELSPLQDISEDAGLVEGRMREDVIFYFY